MAALMEDVLVFGRVEAGRLEFRPSTFDLTEACRRWTEEILRTTDHRCPIRLSIELGLPPPVAQGDPDLLRHIVTNLLSNAVKYSPDGGLIDFLVERDEGIAVFRIEDRGLGIPAADLDSLFTAFQRGSNVSHLPGTGLGLAVIRHCLDLHRGRIELTSQEGLGTRATARIPLFLPASP
jgi:signal transduction histidine kinase